MDDNTDIERGCRSEELAESVKGADLPSAPTPIPRFPAARMKLDGSVTAFWKLQEEKANGIHFVRATCPTCGITGDVLFGDWHRCIVCGTVIKVDEVKDV